MAQPIKPNFIKEREQQKEEQEQLRIKEQHKKEKQEKRDKKITNKSKENTSGQKRRIPAFIVVGTFIILGCLIGTFVFVNKANNKIDNTESSAESSIQDISEQKRQEEAKSPESLYQKEAETLWNKYQNELDCNENTFIETYKKYRNQGLEINEAYELVWNDYMKIDVESTNKVNETEKKQETEEIKSVPQQEPMNESYQESNDSFEEESINEIEATPWVASPEEWERAGEHVDPSWTVE